MNTYPAIAGTRVIAFGGHARSGKDTAAQILHAINPLASACFAFSDAIAAYCRVAGSMTRRAPRVLQEVGYALRQTNPSVWLDALYWRLDEVRPKLALITGVRFPDEIAMVRSMGGALVWIERVLPNGTCVRATDRDLEFPTETAVVRAEFDHLLVNPDGDEGAFKMRVLECYADLTR